MEKLFLETKAQVDETGAIEALAWPFGSPDRLGDEILPGSFKATKVPLPLLAFHDASDPVGSWHEATETKEGLRLRGRLLVDDLPRAREVRALVQAGAATGVSIGFLINKAAAKKGGGRTISSLELLECSIVSIPAHPGARVVSAKSAIAALQIATSLQRAAAQIRGNSR